MSAIVSDFELSFRRIDLKGSPIEIKCEVCDLIQLHCDILQLSFNQFLFFVSQIYVYNVVVHYPQVC